MFSLGMQFGFGIAVAFIAVEAVQYVAQMVYSRYRCHKIKKLIGNTEDFTDNLTERMTVEERNKIRLLYNNLREGLSDCHESCVYDALESLKEIFGKEIFDAD